MKKGLRPA